MSTTVDHVQQRGTSFRYRRKLPPKLKPVIGKGEIFIPPGNTKSEVLRAYPEAHRKAEAILASAWDEVDGAKKPIAGEIDIQNLVLGHALEGEGKRSGGPAGGL